MGVFIDLYYPKLGSVPLYNFIFITYPFLQITSEDNTVSRLKYLPRVLIDFVHTLLSHPTEQEVKCSCHLLKVIT